MDRKYLDNGLLWLMLISIGAVCILSLYVGVTGMAKTISIANTPVQGAYAVTGYLLFILIPLMIVSLMLDNVYINRLLEWSTAILLIAVVIDLVAVTILYLAAYWVDIP